MGSYETLADGGSTNSDGPMQVYLYYDSSDAESAIDSNFTGAVHYMCQQLLDAGTIGRYEIQKYQSTVSVSGSGRDEVKSNFEDWLQDNNLTSNGAHVLSTTNADAGVAGGGNSTYWNAFGNWRPAIVPAEPGSYGDNICIHEAVHPFINSSLDDIKDLLGPDNNEHSLGTDYSNGSRSPLATSYSDMDKKGECSNNNWFLNSYSQDLTDCTKDAVEYSRNDVINS